MQNSKDASDGEGLPYIQTAENKEFEEKATSPVSTSITSLNMKAVSKVSKLNKEGGSSPLPTFRQTGDGMVPDYTPNYNEHIGFNKAYLVDGLKDGIIRLILIVSLMAGWISAAAVARDQNLFNDIVWADFASTRTAYLVIVVLAFIISIIIFVLNITNIVRLTPVQNIPWSLIFIILDIIFLICIFALSVTASVREGQLRAYGPVLYTIFNKGAFASCAAFGFLSVVLLIILVVIGFVNLKSENFQFPFRSRVVERPKVELEANPNYITEIPVVVERNTEVIS